MSTPPPRRILHVDMDAFFASVEQRDDPSLRGRPVVVGGSPQGRGVVAAASYEARRFGIHSAMPAARALRLCPDVVFVRGNFDRYREVSQAVNSIFRRWTDLVEPLSLDEAYLDVTENHMGEPSGTRVAQAIRAAIWDELQLTASAGVAPLKFVAKIASDFRKPDGLTVVPPGRVLAFIHPLDIDKLWGVGPVTARRLRAAGFHRVGDLAASPVEALARVLGERGAHLHAMANGRDVRRVRPRGARRSRSAERTFSEDVTEVGALHETLRAQAERVCGGLKKGACGRTVTLKLRYHDFTTITRAYTLPHPTDASGDVYRAACALLGRTDAGRVPVRLVGVGLSGFTPPSPQLRLPFLG